MDNINWLSMILSTITPLVIGLTYFHKKVFGKALSDSIDTSDKKLNKFILVIVSLILSFFLSFFLLNFNNDGINQEGDFDTFGHGVWHGVFIAITVVSPVVIITETFGLKRWKNMLIIICYWIITLALMGGLLDAMNHWENVIVS
ncbi:DUF1761 family protein [Winogradskyella haliclonae]|uniref:DUF1761 domain-containing protein n=1 Tax=Winogradskyella haliclonae TaxID=2048558 RepID=A0ABQ2C0I7_9FLAO|nr:DUF1761 family protein [Winogradskyella haliclonae]GGI57721.1 hypothetical protein GCM10011444_20300 [Winogradskyella haliclonae]